MCFAASARVHPAEVSAPRVYVGLFVRCVWLKVWLAVSDASWVASVIITLSARNDFPALARMFRIVLTCNAHETLNRHSRVGWASQLSPPA